MFVRSVMKKSEKDSIAIFSTVLIPLIIFLGFVFSSSSSADIIVDDSFGQAGSLAGPDYMIGDQIGQQIGGNLFHSFSVFDLFSNESATFTGPDTVDNIISRVTGGNESFIDGLLASTIEGADMYFLNPAGVMFGPNAELDIQGSFHVSTADYLILSDGGRFDATNPSNRVLTVAPPAAFGFLGAPSDITIQESYLEVPEGETMSLIGGNLNIFNSNLYATSGVINLISLASPGEVTWDGIYPIVDSFPKLGMIDITDTRSVSERPSYSFNPDLVVGNIDVSGTDTSESGAGYIFIRGDGFVTDRSFVFADTFGSAPGGGIDIRIDGDTELTNSSFIIAETNGDGDGGNIEVQTGTLTIIDGSGISTGSRGAGEGGSLNVRVSGDLSISGSDSGIFSIARGSGSSGSIYINAPDILIDESGLIQSLTLGDGNSGDITLDVNNLTLLNGSQIDGSCRAGSGSGGDLTITATDTVSLAGSDSFGFPSAIFSNSFAGGNGGSVSINTVNLYVTGGAQIDVGTRFGSTGSGGDLTISATDTVSISGTDIFGTRSGLFSNTFGEGDSGNISVATTSLFLDDDAKISANTSDVGNAGNITISAVDYFSWDGLLQSLTMGAGNAGSMLLEVENLTLLNSAQIDVGNRVGSTGSGGDLTIIASDTVALSGTDSSGNFPSAIFSNTYGSGDGGSVSINTANLYVTEGAQIDVGTRSGSTGSGGNLTITAMDTVALYGIDINGIGSKLLSNTRGEGDGGGISITAPELWILDGGIFASTSSVGNAGRVEINAGDFTVVDGLIHSTTSGAGNAGGIVIGVENLTLLDGGQIDVSAREGSTGNGGDLNITADGTIALSGEDATFTFPSAIFSNTSGEGSGGRVLINTNDLHITDGAQIDVGTRVGSSGNGGDLTINATGEVSIEDTSSGILSNSLGTGDGGSISIFATLLSVLDGEVNASTSDIGNAGDILMEVDSLMLSGDITASTDFTGRGGNVTIIASESVDIYGEVTTETFWEGDGGSISITTPSLNITESGRLAATTEDAGDAGDVIIDVDNLSITDGARIDVGTLAESTGRGGNLVITATDKVLISGETVACDGCLGIRSGLFSDTSGFGDGGSISITTNTLAIEDGAVIDLGSFGEGNGGSLTINASDTVSISGTESLTFYGSSINSDTFGKGDGGSVTINTNNLFLADGGVIELDSFGVGRAGNLVINALDTIRISSAGRGSDFFTDNPSGITSTASGFGDGGSISIEAMNLFLENGGQIDVGTAESSVGNGGDLTVDISDMVSISGEDSWGIDSGLFSNTNGEGNGGSISLMASTLTLKDHGRINANARFTGGAGDITVRAGDVFLSDSSLIQSLTTSVGNAGDIFFDVGNLTLSGGSQIDVGARTGSIGDGGTLFIRASDTVTISGFTTDEEGNMFLSGLFSRASGEGDGGSISVVASALTLEDEGTISASTDGVGSGGLIELNVFSLLMDSGSLISASTFGFGDAGDIIIRAVDITARDVSLIQTLTGHDGNAGDILLEVENLTLLETGQIDASARSGSTGRGGTVTINASDTVTISGYTTDDGDTFPSGIFSTARGLGDGGSISITAANLNISDQGGIFGFTTLLGDGGNIQLNAGEIGLTDDAQITARSLGFGNAGNIDINVGDKLSSENSSIVTEADQAVGGNITISGGDVILTKNSEITASVASGEGGGGNVTINADAFTALEDSDITARADQGFGGNITINSKVVLFSDDIDLDASSNVEGREGTVAVNSPDIDISGGLVALTESFLDVEALLPARCEARNPEEESSFVIMKRKGIPLNIDDLLRFP
jgi:filamentous hemagglutinin family protein